MGRILAVVGRPLLLLALLAPFPWAPAGARGFDVGVPHLHAVARVAGDVWIVGEQGRC